MSATPERTLADTERLIADLQRRLAEREAELAEAREQQVATAEILEVINSSPGDLAPVFDIILEKAHALCGARHGYLLVRQAGGFRLTAAHDETPFASYWRQQGSFRPPEGSLLERILRGERVVHLADAMAYDGYRGTPMGQSIVESGVRTLLLLSLRRDDELLGVLTAYRHEVRPFTDKQIALLENFAAQAVIAMENARLITETKEALEQQTATAEVLQVINSSPGDLAPVFDAILEKAMRLCEAAFGMMGTIDGDELRTVAARGLPKAFAEFRKDNPPVHGSGTARARILSGERVVHILDLRNEEFYRTADPNRRAVIDLGGARTVLLVALEKDGVLLGHIGVYRQEVQSFSESRSLCCRISQRRQSSRWRTRVFWTNCVNALMRWRS
jgi:GAF domain-containing protein